MDGSITLFTHESDLHFFSALQMALFAVPPLLVLLFLFSCVPNIQWFSLLYFAPERLAFFGPLAMGDMLWYSSMMITSSLNYSRKVSFLPEAFMPNL
jgi:hypothetical protein